MKWEKSNFQQKKEEEEEEEEERMKFFWNRLRIKLQVQIFEFCFKLHIPNFQVKIFIPKFKNFIV